MEDNIQGICHQIREIVHAEDVSSVIAYLAVYITHQFVLEEFRDAFLLAALYGQVQRVHPHFVVALQV
jgi:hypothetical protein